MPTKKKKLIKIIPTCILLLVLMVVVYAFGRETIMLYETQAGNKADIRLFIVPNMIRMGLMEEFKIRVMLESERVAAEEIMVVVEYDSDKLRLVREVEPSFHFGSLESKVDDKGVTLLGSGSMLGCGTIGVLTFQAIGQGEARIKVGGTSLVWSKGKTNNLLREISGARVLID